MEKSLVTRASERPRDDVSSKAYLYHMVPPDMRGTTLHPLNTLKEIFPELYASKVEKYKDREHIMKQFIPALEAAWNDVLHFTAVKPEELKKALVESGMESREMKFYQIDPALLDPSQTTIYLYQKKESGDKMNPENFRKYDFKHVGEYAPLPQETKQYYKDMFAAGKWPLLFVGVPHILHKGSIEISGVPIITV